ncbi:MAG: hypothetical protein RLZZ383_509 [Pseudomonadota bacterium]
MSFENPTDAPNIELPDSLDIPVLAIRNTVIFPVLAFPINVGRAQSVRAVELAMATSDKLLGIVAQRDGKTETPGPSELHGVGTIVKILKMVKMPGNKLNVIIQGISRAEVAEWTQTDEVLRARLLPRKQEEAKGDEVRALTATLRELAQRVIELSPSIPAEASFLVRSIEEPGVLADVVASNLSMSGEDKQDLLETFSTQERLEKVIAQLQRDLNVLEVSTKIQSEVKGEMDKAQRDYFLREQLKAIQKELGEADERQEEFDEVKKNIKKARMPKHVEQVAVKELKRMARMSPGAAEYTVSRTYLDWLCDVPWNTESEDRLDVSEAEAVLDADHYGLEKVKRRILEYLAVLQLKKDMKSPILCLVGPPGVGKTSLAKSVARALNRKMERISLGGVRDEAEIRGHRRTYIGSMPGKIVKSLKKAGTRNPVFVLDEIDKLGNDHRGDPSSALLEVLDPEQNDTFHDHYLDVDVDLSRALFIATANVADQIPGPLRDRMEVIRISGYTHREKTEIARRYLWPTALAAHGLTSEQVEITDGGLSTLVEEYTREAGVRGLKREVDAVCRRVAMVVARGRVEGKMELDRTKIRRILGASRGVRNHEREVVDPGVTRGLAWTAAGGDTLLIEAARMKGKGNLTLTGSLGDVMKESVSVGRSFVKSICEHLGIEESEWDVSDVHIHVPEGAVPKDGPSAGVTMVTTLASLFTGLKVDSELAMTGEIDLHGNVLPVGGIKEKVDAAARARLEPQIDDEVWGDEEAEELWIANPIDAAGETSNAKAAIKRVLLPWDNRRDIFDVSKDVRERLEIIPVQRVEQVLDFALGAENLKARRDALAARRAASVAEA